MGHGKLDFSVKPGDIFLLITRFACGVEVGGQFIVTGGTDGKTTLDTVARYRDSGEVTYMNPMKMARRGHACSKFVTDSGETVSYSFLSFF